MSLLLPLNNPVLPFNEEKLGIPGLSYGEFDLTDLTDESAPFKTAFFSVDIDAKTPIDEHRVRECWYIISGNGILNYQGKEHAVSAQQLLFFESDHSHFIHNTGNEELRVLSLWWPRQESH